MKRQRSGRSILVALALTIPFLAVGALAMAHGVEELSSDPLALVVRGGVLYDKWSAVLAVDGPKSTHPAYAKTKGKQKGASTWRCKECHGWDYLGKDGTYAKGSHFSGIAGIRGASGSSTAAIVQSLKGPDHQLGEHLSDGEMQAIALFVQEGLMDTDQVIDRASKKAKGDKAKGARIFVTVCAKCHGFDGKKINFGDEKEPEYLGTVAAGNPWETLHKIRFGQPGQNMPAMIAFPLEMQVDVLAYAQTLPTK